MGIGAFLDRAIGVISPGWGFRRATARAGLDLLSSTANGRRGPFNPNPRPPRQFVPDTSMRAAGRVTERQRDRDDARQLVNSNPLARAAVNRWKTYVAGTGPEVRSKNPDAAWADLATKRFAEWAFSPNFEVRGRHIGQVISQFTKSGKIDGDCALALIDAGEYAGRVQLLTADRIWSASPISASDGRRVIDGVEIDAVGNPTAYHVRVSDWAKDFTTIRTAAESIIFHKFDSLHPDDVRGNPFASSTADKFVAADTLMGATVTAASLAAKLALVVKTLNPPKYRPPADGDTKPTTEVEDGQMVRLRQGEDITAIQGTHPQAQVSPFLIDLIRVIGAAEDTPMELLLLHFGLGSFASTNAAFTIFATAVHEAQQDLINGPLARLWCWWVDRETGQALKAAIVQGVIAAGATVTIDLHALSDVFGLALSTGANKIKGLALLNTSGAGTDCHFLFGPGASNPFTGPFGGTAPTVECRVGHPPLMFFRLDGWTDSLAAVKNVDIQNPGSVQGSYQLMVIVG